MPAEGDVLQLVDGHQAWAPIGAEDFLQLVDGHQEFAGPGSGLTLQGSAGHQQFAAQPVVDAFNASDGPLGDDTENPWTDLDTGWLVDDHHAVADMGDGLGVARWELDSNETDVRVAAVFSGWAAPGNLTCRLYARMADDAETAYLVAATQGWGFEGIEIGTVSGGSLNVLDNQAADLTPPFTIEVEVIGTTLKGYLNGVELCSVTDGSITMGSEVGLMFYSEDGANVIEIERVVLRSAA